MLPFGEKEMLTELVTVSRLPGFSDKIPHNLPFCEAGLRRRAISLWASMRKRRVC
jgi:hypothetical protein